MKKTTKAQKIQSPKRGKPVAVEKMRACDPVLRGQHELPDYVEDDMCINTYFAKLERMNRRSGACPDDVESACPFLHYMPRESYNETGAPRELDFTGDYRRYDV